MHSTAQKHGLTEYALSRSMFNVEQESVFKAPLI